MMTPAASEGESHVIRMENAEVGLALMLTGGPGNSTSGCVVMVRGGEDAPGPCSECANTRTV